MNVIYDADTDILSFELKSGEVAESDEEKQGMIIDYGADGSLLGFEIMDASKSVPDYMEMQFSIRGNLS